MHSAIIPAKSLMQELVKLYMYKSVTIMKTGLPMTEIVHGQISNYIVKTGLAMARLADVGAMAL